MKNNTRTTCVSCHCEEYTKKNREPESTSPGCSQAINKKTLVTDTPDTMLNKNNPIPNFLIQKSEKCFEKEDNVKYDGFKISV
ncbi:hypothetical protein V1477_009286 [Vespula maculifrons]|uniref:Uncharacterized protein n=1 Tax=Vespula maculifrons TaxID=7453 RepID=A0ABD2C9C8_VESMC